MAVDQFQDYCSEGLNMTSSLTRVSSTEWQDRRNEDDVMIPCRQGIALGLNSCPTTEGTVLVMKYNYA